MLQAILAAAMVIPCVSGTEDLKLEGITMNEERFLTVLANIIGQVCV